MGGGPDPANGGHIQTISFHEGRNFLGATFKKAHVYPPGVCEARALVNRVDEPPTENPPPAAAEFPLDSPLSFMAIEPVTTRGPALEESSAAGKDPIVAGGPNSNRGPDTQDQEMFYIDPRLRPSSSLPPVSSSPAQLDMAHEVHMAPPFSLQTLDTQQFNFLATYTFALPAVISMVLAASGAPELLGASFSAPLSVLLATSSDPLIPAALDPPSVPAARKKTPSRKAPTKKKPRGYEFFSLLKTRSL
ncbi:hypothetical protein BDZ94DRAFT_1315576 [Collybia nuda]|uniref:Uncharacterized protein n=1 Tax=Collybia nuda TaxID=64659 RepID=A0A9P5XS87_9AGAR|nr:hypothetical protein BDZ94DRAFT_1315576 [Collybia nuda]